MIKSLFAALALLTVVALAMFARTLMSSPLPIPAAYAGPIPVASPPADMRVYQIPTGVTHRSSGFAHRGGSFLDLRDFAMAGVLVTHPRGDVLIDTGFGRGLEAHIAMMPFFFRVTTSYTYGRSAAEQLADIHYDTRSLRGILLTHAHWDHVSGLPDFPGTPVWVTSDERRFIADGGWVTSVARAFENVRYEEYPFADRPYLGFARSYDVYGDGAIVVVPVPGHTPGSVVVFLTVASGTRYALLGDLVWQREGVTAREERSWLFRSLADSDAEGVRDGILRIAALTARMPELTLVPAHDVRGFDVMPRLGDR